MPENLNTADPSNQSNQVATGKVIVVGGGLAGITAALVLARAGKSVTLIEAKRRLGGRAGSFSATNEAGQEQVVDYCQHVGMGCCHGLRQLIQWLGQEEFWEEHRELHFYGPDGNYRRLSALPLLPAPFHLAGWLLKWPGLGMVDRCSIAYGMWRIRQLRPDEHLDGISALEWLRANRQTRRAIDHFWSTIIVSALGEEMHRVSLAAVCKVLQDGFLNRRDAFHLLVPNCSLERLFNAGAQKALAEADVTVRLSAAVKKVVRRSDEIEVHCDSEALKAESLICAVPWNRVAQVSWMADDRRLASFDALGSGLKGSPITGVHTWWSSQWLPTPHAAIVGRKCQWVFPKSSPATSGVSPEDFWNAEPGKEHEAQKHEQYYQIVISGSRELSSDRSGDLGREISDDLAHVFPGVKQSRLLRYKAVTDPQAVFSVVPGALRHRPPSESGVDNIWLAGDWTRTGWPSTMEIAILSGITAAEKVLAKDPNTTLGKPARAAK